MSELPLDTIIEILSRLPVKSVCRFRCVSKTWLVLTHEPHFVAAHLRRHQKQKIIFSANLCLFSLDKEAHVGAGIIPSELDFPRDDNGFVDLLYLVLVMVWSALGLYQTHFLCSILQLGSPRGYKWKSRRFNLRERPSKDLLTEKHY